jgi:pyruvate/2-oxoglutarate dehydrogenase complex dihydrolipoamide dehydrogenase (E3) component
MAHVQSVIAAVGEHDAPARYEKLGAGVRIGAPKFVSPSELALDGEKLAAKAFLLATGSRPRLPEVPGLAEAAPLTSDSIFSLTAIPKSLVVIGGGPIGLELGQAMARLGAQVTILQRAERLMAREEPECSTEIRARLEAEGVVVHTGVTIARVRSDGARKIVECTQAGTPLEVATDAILCATGRAPNVESLGLDAAGVEHDAHRIAVDDELRTTNARVFAAGDLTGRFRFTHMAGYEAVIAVRNALLPLATKVDYRVTPWCTFTAPEVARVGMSEAEARALGEVEVLRAGFDAVDRAHTEGDTHGLAKLIVLRGKLVGAHVVGARAGELIHVAALAIREKLPLKSLAQMNWIYPTLSEILRKASQSHYEEVLARRPVRGAISLLRRFKGD